MVEIIKILEVLGTVAFAISGALIAINAGLDIFGVVFVGCITAFGGGILRDILLGIIPPGVFGDFSIFLVAIITAIIIFTVSYINRNKFIVFKKRIEYINNFFDAVGLAAFSVIGSEIACTNGFSDNCFLVVIIGMLTGVGGGIFRDILIDTTPYVFKKHIYALASIIGSLLYFLIRRHTENITLSSVLSMLIVVVIRLLATKYCWNLPKIHMNNTQE